MALIRISGTEKINLSKVDMGLVNFYLSHKKLMSNLDNWVLSPDYDNLPDLMKLRDLINKHQPTSNDTKLYRGFILGEPTQNTHGLDYNKLNSNTEKRIEITINKPTSFTTSLDIANAFGSTVISITPGKLTKYFLRMTDEVAVGLCKLRNIKPETQHEWIYIPDVPMKITADVLSYAKRGFLGIF